MSLPRLELLHEEKAPRAFPLPAGLRAAYGGDLGFERPRVFANFVSSVDGVVALEEREESGGIISGRDEGDRFVMGLLRACADGVLVGAGTFRKAGPHLWYPERIFPEAAPAWTCAPPEPESSRFPARAGAARSFTCAIRLCGPDPARPAPARRGSSPPGRRDSRRARVRRCRRDRRGRARGRPWAMRLALDAEDGRRVRRLGGPVSQALLHALAYQAHSSVDSDGGTGGAASQRGEQLPGTRGGLRRQSVPAFRILVDGALPCAHRRAQRDARLEGGAGELAGESDAADEALVGPGAEGRRVEGGNGEEVAELDGSGLVRLEEGASLARRAADDLVRRPGVGE